MSAIVAATSCRPTMPTRHCPSAGSCWPAAWRSHASSFPLDEPVAAAWRDALALSAALPAAPILTLAPAGAPPAIAATMAAWRVATLATAPRDAMHARERRQLRELCVGAGAAKLVWAGLELAIVHLVLRGAAAQPAWPNTAGGGPMERGTGVLVSPLSRTLGQAEDRPQPRRRSLAVNGRELIAAMVLGQIAHPVGRATAYRIGQDGTPRVLPGTGGITLNCRIGDRCIGLAGDHIEPGVSLHNNDREVIGLRSGPNLALMTYACIGNRAQVTTGPCIGAVGLVTGKHGGSTTSWSTSRPRCWRGYGSATGCRSPASDWACGWWTGRSSKRRTAPRISCVGWGCGSNTAGSSCRLPTLCPAP